MCGPFGSNYDGYERLMYPFYSRELVRDCESFKCDYEIIESPHMAHSSDFGYAPNEEEDINWKVSNIEIRTTLT